ncbi:MAG: sensor histidine kinase, partial [Methylocella sp.]
PPEGASFDALIDITIYRVVQESLSNAVRHGNPAEISISVTPSATGGPGLDCVTVEVSNDGAGMDKTAGFGFGLTGMRERVQALGGRLVLAQEPGLGFSVTATFPVPAGSGQVRATSFAGNA